MIGPRLALLATLLGAPLAAAAETPAAPGAPGEAEAADSDAGPEPVPPAADTLAGHLLLNAGPQLSLPFARLDDQTAFSEAAGLGLGVSGKLGIGVSRGLALGGFAEYTAFDNPSDCTSCKATTLAFGPFVRYHLVQGVRFDPQIALGVGYRKLDATTEDGKYRYTGIDWLKLELGGTWYAISQLGFGPYAELTLGSFTKRPADRDAAVYGSFSVGLRLALDAQGK
jgi:hypothetical protein